MMDAKMYRQLQHDLASWKAFETTCQEDHNHACQKIEEIEQKLADATPEIIYLSSTEQYRVIFNYQLSNPRMVEYAHGYIYRQQWRDLRIVTLDDGDWLVATVDGPKR